MLGVEILANRYRLLDRLGEGGMSVVWRAVDEVLDREVAVKVLGPRFAGDAMSRARVLAEARAAGRLNHPHVTAVYDYGESVDDSDHPVPFVVMELLTEGSLAQRLTQGPLAVDQALQICAQVASALAAAHARGLVHRDVKPGNVMLASGGAKLADFGLAAAAGDREDDEDAPFLGTPAYLAPERLCGDMVVAATDVYALGLLLYQLLTGRLPWHTDTTTQMLKAHVYLEPAPLPPLTAVPPSVATLVRRCLAKDPDDRPTSAQMAVTLAGAAGIRVPLEDDPEATMVTAGAVVAGPTPVVARAAVPVPPPAGPVAAPAGTFDPTLDHVELRRQASLAVREQVGFDLAIWAVLDPATLMWASCVVDGGPYDDAFERELFVNEYGQDDVLKLVDLADGPLVGTLSARTHGFPKSSRRFRTVLEPRGFADELRVVFHDGDAAWGALLLYRAGEHFTDADVAALEPAVVPFAGALRRALERADDEPPGPEPVTSPSKRLPRTPWGRRRHRQPPSTNGSRRPATGRILLAPDGRMLAMTDEARALLETGDLGQLMHAVTDGRPSGVVDRTDGPRPDGRVLGYVASPDERGITVAVRLIRPHEVSRHVAAALGLSPSQRHVLESVARGRADREIAHDLGTSVYAVQDDLVSLFKVFGVDGRPNLVQALFFDYYLPLHATDAQVPGGFVADHTPAYSPH